MSLYRKDNSKVWMCNFWWNGEHVQFSTRTTNKQAARKVEAKRRIDLATGEAGIHQRKPAPTLKGFAQRFIDAIEVRCAEKPRTIAFYVEKLQRLLEFEPLANSRLDRIDEALIEALVQERRKRVAPATVNRQLATLRRLLRLAQEWRVIDRVPRIRLLPGERSREFVLSHEREAEYLEAAPQPLRDIALLTLDAGLRIGEAVVLECADVHLEPVNGARFGYLRVRRGKSKNAKRNLSLTPRVREMLATRMNGSPYVFPSDTGRPYLVTSMDHLHSEVREALGLPAEFVIHSLRHTFGTRLGEAGADAIAIMKAMGHSSVTVSQKYVHPTPEHMERTFERLVNLNQQAARSLESKKAELLSNLLPEAVDHQ